MPSTISELLGLLGNAGAVANVQTVRREQHRRDALVDTLLEAVARADARRTSSYDKATATATATAAAA